MSLLYCNIFINIFAHTLVFHKYREHNSGQKNKSKPTHSLMVAQHTYPVYIDKNVFMYLL